eukprot:5119459-Amphidinium_carterae.1
MPWGQHLHCDGAAYHPQWQLLRRAGWAVVEVWPNGLLKKAAFGPLPYWLSVTQSAAAAEAFAVLMALWLQPEELVVNTDCLGVVTAFGSQNRESAVNDHLWQLLRWAGKDRLTLRHVRLHQKEPVAFLETPWKDWNANRLADVYAKEGASQHLQ